MPQRDNRIKPSQVLLLVGAEREEGEAEEGSTERDERGSSAVLFWPLLDVGEVSVELLTELLFVAGNGVCVNAGDTVSD